MGGNQLGRGVRKLRESCDRRYSLQQQSLEESVIPGKERYWSVVGGQCCIFFWFQSGCCLHTTPNFGHRFRLYEVGQKYSEQLLCHVAQVENKFYGDIIVARIPGFTIFKASSNSISVNGESFEDWTR